MTRVQLQTGDLFRDDRSTGVGFRQQARVVVLQHRHSRELITVLEYSVGNAELNGSAAFGQVVRCRAWVWLAVVIKSAVALLEEVDTAGASATFTTVQADSVLANHIHTHTYSALGEAGLELADEALAPFSFVLLAVFVVTADVGVTCCDVQVAVFNETLGLLLVVCHCCRCAQNPQSDQTHPLLQHFLIFLITG